MTHLKGVELSLVCTNNKIKAINSETLKCHQLYLNPSKSIFVMKEVEFLGHVIESEKVYIDHKKDFLVEYNFALKYKLGQINVVTNALSHQGAIAEATTLSTSTGDFLDEIRASYTIDSTAKQLIQ
ncbi:unnamed protein product [Spirodela intermedia]|uniref:Uncharacterized protein n=1 Tax=Spirodela intermedia TaxID=51605 RepID=A0A7I8LIU1_SPIIN|nr:unnamed protein product [Spirodela intermedia]